MLAKITLPEKIRQTWKLPRLTPKRTLIWVSLIGFCVFTLFPFVWMLATSLRANTEMYNTQLNPFIVRQPTLEHYRYLLAETKFLRWLFNSAVVALAASAISMVCGVLASYSVGRLRFPGGGFTSLILFATYLIPTTLLFIPLSYVVNLLGISNSLWSLILTYPTFLIPFICWILSGYFKTVPKELSEAALVDGATRLQSLFLVDIPLILPGIISVFFFSFTFSWNEYLYAFTFIRSQSILPISVAAVNALQSGDVYFWGELMAAALLGSLPVVIIYAFLMDFYISGLTAGSVKG